jgi:putative ABC transport system permease protein
MLILNYLKVALRHISRYKALSFIKVFGLSLGIASCLFIYLFVADELSFDDFHENKDGLFRLIQIQYDADSHRESGRQQFIPAPVGPELVRAVPDVLRQSRFYQGRGVVRFKNKTFNESLTMVDPSFLEMFTFPLLEGDPRSALADGQRVVLTRSCALKYFGAEDPLGQMMTVSYGRSSQDYIVTGVARDVPANSTLRFDLLVRFENLALETNNPGILNDWGRWFCPLFVQLQPNATPGAVASKLDGFCRRAFGASLQRAADEGEGRFTLGLQSIKDLHRDARFTGTAGLSTSYLLSAVALAILLIACVNFVNLSIGSSSARSVEVGMRRVLGAERRQLVGQFVSEAFVISFLATLVGLLFAELLIPTFNALSGKRIALATLWGSAHGLAVPAIIVLSALLAGSYPAAVLSSFRPVDVLKGKLRLGGRTALTKGLIVVQFALSVTLGLSAVILGRQVAFMTKKDPGYVSGGLVVVLTQENDPIESERLYRRFRNEIVFQSRIQGVTASNREFGLFLPGSTLELDGRKIGYRFNRVDPYFLATMKCRLTEGRDFSSGSALDRDALIVNECFVKRLGPDFGLGKTLDDSSRGFPYDRRIIGVIEDCHFRSLRSEIEPLILYTGEGSAPNRNTFSRIIVRVDAGRTQETLADLESAWRRIQPDKPFVSYFQDDALRGLYIQEKRWDAIIRHASVLSVMLACLGIFGLTSVGLSRRVKEIGIRKVLGASAKDIIVLASREFILLISLANVVAGPIVLFAMKRVLGNYAYRIGIGSSYFILAWLASLAIAAATIFYLCAKAAHRNPVESLRYE